MAGTGSRRTDKRQAILDGTESLLLTAGYRAITYRAVATAAGVTPGLVQYYFPSIDDLFIAVLRESTDRLIDRLTTSADSSQPLRMVWEYASDPGGTALLMQFMALANQIPEVMNVVGEGGERVRGALVEKLSTHWDDYGLTDAEVTPAAVLFLLSAIPRMIYLEQSLGTNIGHADVLALVQQFLDRTEPTPS